MGWSVVSRPTVTGKSWCTWFEDLALRERQDGQGTRHGLSRRSLRPTSGKDLVHTTLWSPTPRFRVSHWCCPMKVVSTQSPGIGFGDRVTL